MTYYDKYTIGLYASAGISIISFLAFMYYTAFVPIEVTFTAQGLPSGINGLYPRIFFIGLSGCLVVLAKAFNKARKKHDF